VLGTLMEKARTVPDTYPLSLNLVTTGCNQKTSREPVMNLSDGEVQQALDELKRLNLVIESHGSRVARYEHNFQRVLGVPDQSAALLGLLMLRGPQTAGELRINAERWHRFADISSVEGFLHELAERSEDKGGPLVRLLPRAPGAREARWMHLLGGPAEAVPAAGSTAARVDGESPPDTEDRLSALEAQVAALRATVERLCAELGLSPAGRPDDDGHAKNPG
jgi:uncharacterized protein YceH (UPF0502 family)